LRNTVYGINPTMQANVHPGFPAGQGNQTDFAHREGGTRETLLALAAPL